MRKTLLAGARGLYGVAEETFFSREKFELLVAPTGQTAYEMVVMHRPDLVFLELDLPEMGGDECCRRIRNNPDVSATPVILTSDDDAEGQARCRAAGCNAVLTNPVTRDALLEVARHYLNVVERGAQRVEARMRVLYGNGHQSLLANYSVNLSTGGLFLEMSDPLPADTPLTLEFSLPNRPAKIRCHGRVAWVNEPEMRRKGSLPPGIGLQFIDLTLDDLHAIRDFVDKEPLSPSW